MIINDTKGYTPYLMEKQYERGYNDGFRAGYDAAKAEGYTHAPLMQEGDDEK